MRKIVGCSLMATLGASCCWAQDKAVDEIELTADTNIVVAAGDTLRIEYLWAGAPYTLTKTGEGQLTLAVVGGGDNITIDVQAGTLASARPGKLPQVGQYPSIIRADASDASTLTKESGPGGGTNYVTQICDADGGTLKFGNWWMGKPYLSGEKLNGLSVLDFGAFTDGKGHTSTDAGMLGMSDYKTYEYLYVWRDRDDAIDAALLSEKEFNGPCVLGNDGNYWSRGVGGAGNGFPMYSDGMMGSMKENLRLDGKAISYAYRVPRGFHLFHNRITGASVPKLGTIGYSYPYKGGVVIAEVVAYSNLLTTAEGNHVEAYLDSKWFCAKVGAVTLAAGATLDVSTVPFVLGALQSTEGARIVGERNLVCKSAKGAVTVRTGETYLCNDTTAGDTPDLSFAEDAKINATGNARVGNITTATGNLSKNGVGALLLADPGSVQDITVESGTLTISPLHVKGAEYHVDATRESTITTAVKDGRNLITEWRDVDRTDRKLTPTTWRKPQFDTSHLVRAPFVTTNALVNKPMVDFGTFADANHTDGWGAEICPNKTFNDSNGLREIFAVWQDYPDLKNESYFYENTPFCGPSLFGMQYHWYRGKGGNGNAFPMHYEGAPSCMYGDMRVDGVKVNGQITRIGDGVHVLAQRIATPGAPFEELGGDWQTGAKKPDGTTGYSVYGGLMIGEVLMFKDTISDVKRARIEGALRGKWTGAANAWAYDSLRVAAGATFQQPYTDVSFDTLNLTGCVAAKSVKAGTLTYADQATIEGTLVLSDGGELVIGSDGKGGFAVLNANVADVSGKGTLTFTTELPVALIGQEVKVVDAPNVTMAAATSWRSASLKMRAKLVRKTDGLYVAFLPSGFLMFVR